MIRKLLFLLLFFELFSQAVSQPPDSLYTTEIDSSDSLTKKSISDTLPVAPIRTFIQDDQFREEVFRSFSLTDEITSEYLDNSIAENAGDLMQMWSLINVAKIGPWGQSECAYPAGNGKGLNVFIDGNLFPPQNLNFPQKGELDLNSILLSNVSKVEFLPAGLANLWGRGAGWMGINIITKDFNGAQPYSRVMTDRGPYGFYRTQVELGRGLTNRGKFYLTGEFNKSDGYILNSDYDGFSFSGKTTLNLTRNMDLRFSTYKYQTNMGLLLFPGVNYQDTRKKVKNWGVVTSLLLQEKKNSILNLNFRYDKQNQEVKSGSYNFEKKKIEETLALTATQTFKIKDRHLVKVESYGERKSFESLRIKRAIHDGYLSFADVLTLSSKLKLLLFSKTEKEESRDVGFSASGGASYQISPDVSLFSTVGRFESNPTLMDRFWLFNSLIFKDTIADYMEEGNGDLRSQKSMVWDFGGNIGKKNYKLNAYAFYSQLDDVIFWSNVDTTIYFGHFQPVNGKAKMWGANINGNLKFLNHVRSYVSYSFIEGKNSIRKTRLPYSPEHSLFGYIEFENEFLKRELGFRLRLETKVLSERFMDEYEKDKESGVAILNGKITVRFLDFHFYYMARNITNRVYRLSGNYYMPKRTYWWGFYWEFSD